MNDDIKEIELVNYLKYKVKISSTYIERKGNRMLFEDIVGIKCKSWEQCANYNGAKAFYGNFNRIILIDNRNNKLDLSFSSFNRKSFDNFNYILSRVSALLLQRNINTIRLGMDVNIYNLNLTKNGICRRNLFGTKFIEWRNCSDVIVDRGFVEIVKLNKNKFSSTNIWKKNAILLPGIVKSLIKKD